MTTPVAKTTPKTERREIMRLGVPFTIGVLSSALTGVIDTAMMGHYGARALAAVASASAVFDVFSTVVVASVSGYQILGARFAGREDGHRVRDSLRATVWLSVPTVISLMLLCLFAGRFLTSLVASGADSGISVTGGQFLLAVSPTLLFSAAFVAVTATFNAYKKAKQPMYAGLCIAILNLLLDWLLIYGPGPFPRLGAVGDGLATSLAWFVGVILIMGMAFRVKLWHNLRTSHDEEPDFQTSVIRLAAPGMVSSALDYASTAVFFGIVGGLGAAALGGSRLAFHIMVLFYGLGMAFSAAVRILVSRSIGAGNAVESRSTWQAGRTTLLVPSVVVGLALILLRVPLADALTGFPDVQGQLAGALVIIGSIIPLIAWNLSNVSVVRAFGKTKLDMYGNIIAALIIQLPVAWFFGRELGFGATGAFGGVAAYWIVRGTLLEVWARRCLEPEEAVPVVSATIVR